jgi:site-specific recombinase XerD
MFGQLFQRPEARARHRDGPLAQERLSYLEHLARQGKTHDFLAVTAYYLLGVVQYLHLATRPDDAISCSEIERAAALWAVRPIKSPRTASHSRTADRFRFYATGWLTFLGRLQLPRARPRCHAEQIAAFAQYMGQQQGLSAETITCRCSALEPFLDRLGAAGGSLAEITLTQVDAALIEQVSQRGYARRTVQTLASILRSFFRYAHSRGWCSAGLAAGIKAPRVYRLETLPQGPSWEDVQRLLGTTEGDRPTDVRDRAILMLLAVYGLRRGEVAGLRLQDFDWERERLDVFRPKTGRTQTYPLSRPVGDAVIRYLKEVRPRSPLREVFLTRRAPWRPLASCALWPIVGGRLRRLGVSLPHHGPHCLRHALAGPGPVAEGGRRLPRPPQAGHDPHLRQGGPRRAAPGRRFRPRRAAMKLQPLIEHYVTFRQALGERFKTNAAILRAFGRTLGCQADVASVQVEQVNAFLSGAGPITRTWHEKHNALLGFYRYAVSRGYATTMPLPAFVPKRPEPFVPYIYSPEDLRRLLDAADSCQGRRFAIEPITLRTAVLLLYAAGLRVREAIHLNRPDVDLASGVLLVRQTKFFKDRLVPIGGQLTPVLVRYAQRAGTGVVAGPEPAPFLTTRAGRRLEHHALQDSFQRLRERAGVRRTDGARYQPRLHDLRHTFAVHRLTSWYRQGADVQKLLPVLSVYLGHAHLASTQAYLSMTPELLQLANRRFERYAGKGGGHD